LEVLIKFNFLQDKPSSSDEGSEESSHEEWKPLSPIVRAKAKGKEIVRRRRSARLQMLRLLSPTPSTSASCRQSGRQSTPRERQQQGPSARISTANPDVRPVGYSDFDKFLKKD
jgi:hypothetical protein